ncbi:MAG: penicillin-binding transpeptidase domain-containing protein [Candidatus Omnitrophota bacterium]
MNRRSDYRYKKAAKGRYFLIFSFFVFFFAFLILRLIYLQVLSHSRYKEIAENSRNVVINLPPKRGVILDRNMEKLAMNVPKYSVYAIPRCITQKEETADMLASVLGINKAEVLEKLSKDKLFVWIDRKVSDEKARKIKERALKGVDFVAESERSYPNNRLLAHVLGFADIDNRGLEGLEMYYDKELRGVSGYRRVVVDAKRRQVSSSDEGFLPARNGYNLVLTIDEAIQHIAEKAMMSAIDRHHVKSASVVVMNPYTGDILALSNYPTYNPNNFADSTPDERRDRAVTDLFEPGSSFKVITASAALSEKVVGLDDEFFCENGEYRIAGKVLHDAHPYGLLKFKNVIEVSSNIGTVKAAQKLGPDKLYKYIKLFGFNNKTGINLPGEVTGILRPTSAWSKTSMVAIPIGQEVGVTAIQLVTAISVIANGGVLLQPRIVDRVIDDKGALIKEFKPKAIRRVISDDTCNKVKEVLRMVVDTGTGKNAALVGYSAAGKTGTGQRLEADGSYSHSKFNSVFIGFAPAENPKLAIAIVFVEPHPYYYGGTVAAPVFSEIATNALGYLSISPDAPKRINPVRSKVPKAPAAPSVRTSNGVKKR